MDQDVTSGEVVKALLDLHKSQPSVATDLASPLRREWGIESVVGQWLKLKQLRLQLLDQLTWEQPEVTLLLTVPELVREFGHFAAALATFGSYLEELAGVTVEELAGSYDRTYLDTTNKPRD